MRTRDLMGNPYMFEKGIQSSILPTPIGLHSTNLAIKLTFNQILEIAKALENFGFMMQAINPSELGVVINKTHIIIKPANRSRSRTPNV